MSPTMRFQSVVYIVSVFTIPWVKKSHTCTKWEHVKNRKFLVSSRSCEHDLVIFYSTSTYGHWSPVDNFLCIIIPTMNKYLGVRNVGPIPISLIKLIWHKSPTKSTFLWWLTTMNEILYFAKYLFAGEAVGVCRYKWLQY